MYALTDSSLTVNTAVVLLMGHCKPSIMTLAAIDDSHVTACGDADVHPKCEASS